MALITIERIKEIRAEIKKKYPNVKFSITRQHLSTVVIAVMESPFEFPENYMQLNPIPMYIKEHHAGKPYLDFLLDLATIASKGKRTVSEDGDYGSIPNFYVQLHIGKWDKPHVTNKSIKI